MPGRALKIEIIRRQWDLLVFRHEQILIRIVQINDEEVVFEMEALADPPADVETTPSDGEAEEGERNG